MKHTIISLTGKTSTIDLPDHLFAAKINEPLMAQAVRVFLGNQRQSGAKTKTRGEIALTTKKWYRQKGTGRARHGAQSAPLFVGGGVSHGPDGNQNYKRTLSQNMRRAALASALTLKHQNKQVSVVDSLPEVSQSKQASKLLSDLKLVGKVTFVMSEYSEGISKAFSNIPNVTIAYANMLNTYKVLNGGSIVFIPVAVEKLTKTFTKKTKQSVVTSQESANKEEVKVSNAAKVAKSTKAEAPKAIAKPAQSKTPAEKTPKVKTSKVKTTK